MLASNQKQLKSEQMPGALPLSVGIIMDGNRRWAAAHGHSRFEGHRQGVEALRRAVRAAPELGVRYLTVYSFSSENWNRPAGEISDLMGLLKMFIRHDLAQLHRSDVRIRVIGERAGLKPDICALLDEAEFLTRGNRTLDLIIAFNYGGRNEILCAVQGLAREVKAGRLEPESINLAMISDYLGTQGIPDPDFIIRTSGEQRLSNFLLWQAAYSELIFLPIHWPEFDKSAFSSAIAEYAGRNRRFGGAVAQEVPRTVLGALRTLATKAGS